MRLWVFVKNQEMREKECVCLKLFVTGARGSVGCLLAEVLYNVGFKFTRSEVCKRSVAELGGQEIKGKKLKIDLIGVFVFQLLFAEEATAAAHSVFL